MNGMTCAGGKGSIKFAGYKNGGLCLPKGMRNKRKRKVRLQREAVEREKMILQQKREERESFDYDDWNN